MAAGLGLGVRENDPCAAYGGGRVAGGRRALGFEGGGFGGGQQLGRDPERLGPHRSVLPLGIMATPAKKKTASTSSRLVCRLIGVPFLIYAACAAVKGEIAQTIQNKHESVIRAAEKPWHFWGLVAALAFAGLVFTVVGFRHRVDDDA